MKNTIADTIFIPGLGETKVNAGNVSINDFDDCMDVIIDGEDTIVKISVRDDDFSVIHAGKGRHDFFAKSGDFKFKDYPEILEFVDWAFELGFIF